MRGVQTVADARLAERAEELVGGPVSLKSLALAFDESAASSAEVLVEGESFYPGMLEDIIGATFGS